MATIIPVDFETKRIDDRPVYPPEPVGVALKLDGKYQYLAWGHPYENNCTKKDAARILKRVFAEDVPLFHNAAFDIEVAAVHLGIPPPKIDFHDTMFLSFLNDPREDSLGLKEMAHKYLNMSPDEQQELKEWILEYVFVVRKMKESKKNPWSAYISEAPGNLVGKYAIGDIVRTEKLFYYFKDEIEQNGMSVAYIREKAVLPIFEDMSRTGVRIAHSKLNRDLKQWHTKQTEREEWIRKRLKSPELDINSPNQLADAMERARKVKSSGWVMTKPSDTFPEGQRSTKRENLVEVCNDAQLVDMLALHGVMGTYIATFAEPWLASAEQFGGRVYPSFNQVRSANGDGAMGTRTGRPSSRNPNFLNVPRNQENPELPNLRDYIVPDEGCAFLIRDYNQQELRITGHYEDGILLKAYQANPRMDVHTFVQDLMKQITGIEFPRSYVKTINFGFIYGMGTEGLMKKLRCTAEDAELLKKSHAKALPGIKELSKDISLFCKRGNPIYTWGGRRYYAEEPAIIHGRRRDFYYKQLNYLIQGSAADCTKEAMYRVDQVIRPLGGRLVLQVYDEIVTCVPLDEVKRGMALQREAMESIEFDIPMFSDGKVGKVSWGKAIKLKEE